MSFLQSLVNSDDKEIDSIIVSGLAVITALIIFTAYAIWQDHASWNPLNFGTAATSILAGIGGGKRLRDGSTSTNSDTK